jgi:omega-6 fatty acid desaturase (delta-12 desaturase)
MIDKNIAPSNFLTGKDLIRASKRFAVDNKTKSWFHILSTTLFLILAFLGSYYSVYMSLKIVFSVLSGLFIVKFFVIYHDYQHGAILKKSTWAKPIMTFFGIFVLAPKNVWKRTHDHHHNNNSKLSNSGIGSYPLLSKEDFENLSTKRKFIYLATRHPLTIFFGYLTLFIFDFNIRSVFTNPIKHWDSVAALAVHISIGYLLFTFGGVSALLLSWIMPFFIANGLGAYLFYAQHNFPGATFEDNKNWKYTEAALHSTSFIKMNPVLSWFTGNIGYHHVHHVNHHIPFYKLKTAMRQMPELQNPVVTTLHPRDIVACLKLKVWDPDKGEMTGLS